MPKLVLTKMQPAPGAPREPIPDQLVGKMSETSRLAAATAAAALAPASTNETQKPGPIFVSIADARTISGLSRSAIYRQLAAGNIRAVKGGSRTLIVLESLIKHLEALPQATFRASR